MSAAPGPDVTDDLGGEVGGFEADRAQVAAASSRLRVAFTVFVLVLLAGLSGLTFTMVTRIFDRLTPTMRHDLEWKVRRGAQELARSTQLGMVVRDEAAVRNAAIDYLRDPEVLGLVVQDAEGETVLAHRVEDAAVPALDSLFAGAEGEVHESEGAFRAWARSEIEGGAVGRVGLVVSKARLAAGEELREDILTVGAVGAALALVLALLFVHFYIGPILRTTMRTFERLEKTTEAALAATRLKSEFLANMSHEIRTPMNGIIGVLDLIRRTPLDAKQRRHVQTIDSSARSLLTIINDILDFSKLEAGRYEVQHRDLEVLQVVQEVGELLAPKAHAKGIEIVQRVEPDVPASIVGDVERLKQVLMNLMGNAIKFTEEGHVSVRVSWQKGTGEGDEQASFLRFDVTDTGPGISQEEQHKLFGAFSQVDGSLTRKHGGTGLGLAISKRLAEAMGGEVGLRSAPGEGSTFWFTVATRPGAIRPRALASRESRVLVIARDEVQRENLLASLESWGMSAVPAVNAEQGRSLVLDCDPEPFDLAIIDAFQEEEEHAQRLLDVCALEGLPLVRLIQTTDSPSSESQGLPQVFLTKPVRVSELYNGIVSLLDGHSFEPITSEPDNDTQTVAARAGAEILVVDDNEINRLVACELLSEFGYAYETAENGQQAVELASSGRFAAILMDCQMPVMDGYEATRAIRELPGEAARVPIIAATAHAMAGDREKVLEAGMDDYTAKPVRARALERVLARWVRLDPDAGVGAGGGASGATEPGLAEEDLATTTTTTTDTAAATAAAGAWNELPAVDASVRRSPKLLEVFLRTFPGDIEAVGAALDAGDVGALRSAAHKVKGGSLSLGLSQLAAAAKHVEYEAAEGRFDAAAVQALPALFERARAELPDAGGKQVGGAS